MPTYVSFYRNVYNGRPNNPTAAQFVSAFLEAGAKEAKSFLANGTIIFSAESIAHAEEINQAATDRLTREVGLKEQAMVRTLSELQDLVSQDRFANAGEDVHERMVCFLAQDVLREDHLPLSSTRKDVTIFAKHGQDALALTYMINGKSGYPTKLIETKFKTPATSRNLRTIERIVDQFR